MAVVYRTPGMAGAGTKLYLYANDQLVGGMGRAAFYSVETPPGPLNLSFSYRAEKNSAGKWAGIAVTTGGVGLLTDAIIQPGAMRKRGDVTLNLQPNEVHYVRIDGFKLTPMSTEAGREEMKDCHWINGPH